MNKLYLTDALLGAMFGLFIWTASVTVTTSIYKRPLEELARLEIKKDSSTFRKTKVKSKRLLMRVRRKLNVEFYKQKPIKLTGAVYER